MLEGHGGEIHLRLSCLARASLCGRGRCLSSSKSTPKTTSDPTSPQLICFLMFLFFPISKAHGATKMISSPWNSLGRRPARHSLPPLRPAENSKRTESAASCVGRVGQRKIQLLGAPQVLRPRSVFYVFFFLGGRDPLKTPKCRWGTSLRRNNFVIQRGAFSLVIERSEDLLDFHPSKGISSIQKSQTLLFQGLLNNLPTPKRPTNAKRGTCGEEPHLWRSVGKAPGEVDVEDLSQGKTKR